MSQFFKKQRFTAKRTPDSAGVIHASEGQANWFSRLREREKRGEILELELEPSFKIVINGEKICDVYADARFVEHGVTRVLDYKGVEGNTPISKLKRKLVKACHGVEIEIVGPAKAAEDRRAEQRAWCKVNGVKLKDLKTTKPPRERTATASCVVHPPVRETSK